MNDAEYHANASALFQTIEELIDQIVEEHDAAMDYENTGGVLTIFLEDTNTQVIVSKQAPTQQIWVAAKSGGFHCVHDGEQWRCTKTNETLPALLSRTCSEQSHSPVNFPTLF